MSLPCGGELHDNLFLILSQFPPHYHTILAINCVHASNWFIHLQQTQQTDGQSDNSVLTVYLVAEDGSRDPDSRESPISDSDYQTRKYPGNIGLAYTGIMVHVRAQRHSR